MMSNEGDIADIEKADERHMRFCVREVRQVDWRQSMLDLKERNLQMNLRGHQTREDCEGHLRGKKVDLGRERDVDEGQY